MPSSSGALHESFRRPKGKWGPFATATLAAALGLSLGAANGCDNSESPSPFVVAALDGGADGAVTEAGTVPPLTVPDAGPGPAAPGEWGGPCLDDGQCSDGIDCTSDACDPGRHQCHFSPNHPVCDDGAFCNGVEQCVPGLGCRPGDAVACSDGTACTIDSCDEATHACNHTPRDADGDGDADGNCPDGHDCNDGDPAVSSLATEICGNGLDDNCDGRIDEPGCKAPAYDGCTDPLDVSAPGSFTLSSEAAALDYSASCIMTSSRSTDLVVALTVRKGGKADVDVVLTSASGTLGIALDGRCGKSSTELGCAAGVETPDGGSVARLLVRGLDPGTYALVLFTDSTNPLTLAVDYRAASKAPANETCGTAIPLVEGDPVVAGLAGAALDVKTACADATGDLVYSFSLAEERDVHLHATAADVYGTPILSLRDSGCHELDCREADNADLFRRALPAGAYLVSVSSTGPSDVEIVLETAPPSEAPPDETCDAPPALEPGKTRVVDLSSHMDDIDGGCAVGAPDAAYALTLDAGSDVLLVEATSSGDRGSVGLTGVACAPGRALVCASAPASPVRAALQGVPAGEYRVVVASELGVPTSLTAFVRPASTATLVPFSDSCADRPTEIPRAGGLFRGNTANASDDYSASCDVGGSGGAPDQLLHLVLTEPRRVIFDGRGSGFAAIVDVRRGPDCPGDELTSACSAGYVANRSYLDLSLDAGDYFVQIDGYDGSSGAWVLDVYVAPR
jgi:hypothetical protein